MKLICLLLVLISIILPAPCCAEEPTHPATKFNYLTEEFPPYNYTKNGQATGRAVDLLRFMWREMDVDEQPITFMPWARAYEMGQTQPQTVLFATLRTMEREPLFKWVGPISQSKTILIGLRDNHIILKSMTDANGLTIGIVREYASASILKEYSDIVKIDTLQTIEMAIKKLLSGRVDLISLEERAFRKVIDEMGLPIDQFEVAWLLHLASSYFAFSNDTPDSIIKQFQKAYDAVMMNPAYTHRLDSYYD